MRVSYSKGYYASIAEDHVFPMKKFGGLHQYLTEQQIVAEKDIIEPSMISLAQLMQVHSQQYAEGIMDGQLSDKVLRKIGLPWSKSLAKRSRLAVQGTLNAAIMALQDGIAGNIAGGTHHAMPTHGEGFCVFNDVAVAIKVLQQSKWAQKILIIDCDVHQGNGTAKIFEDDLSVFTFSLHGANNYPFKKPPSTLDIGLPDETTDRDYLQTLGDAMDQIFQSFAPDLVFYLGGIDPLEKDHLGRLSLSSKGLQNRDEIVTRRVRKENIPLVLLLSGGYGPTLKDTVLAHALMYETADAVYS